MLSRGDATQRSADPTDRGFTLMEVIVALALLSIVATAALAFFVNGTRSVTAQQRQQTAITLANDAMETAFGRAATRTPLGVSGLIAGRTKADVTDTWSAVSAFNVPGLSDTYPAWDTATLPTPLAGPADDAVPQQSTGKYSRVDYTVRTLIGTCFRVTTNPDGPCTKVGGTSAGVANTGYSALMRVMSVVTWGDVAGGCSGGVCSYAVSSLMDPSSDLKWNNTTRMVAIDDTIATNAGVPVTVNVMYNDTLVVLSTGLNPVKILDGSGTPVSSLTITDSGSTMGTAVVNGDGSITFTPTLDAHGKVSFTYRVSANAVSAQALVTVFVAPQAKDYTLNATVGTAINQVVQTRTGASPGTLAISTPPSAGTASVTGTGSTTISYNPTASGTFSLQYTYTDPDSKLVSLPGRITYTVVAYAPPGATTPASKTVPASSTPAVQVLQLQTATGNPADYQVKIASLPAAGTLQVDGVNATVGAVGSNVTFQPPPATVGTFTFNVWILTPDLAQQSSQVTVTVKTVLVLTAAPDSFSATKSTNTSTKTKALTPFSNDTFATGGNVSAAIIGTPSCGSVSPSTWNNLTQAALKSSNVTFTSPKTAGSCNFQYRLTDVTTGATSDATVTVTVS